MKYLFSLTVPLLLLFAVVTYNADETPEAYYDYETFAEFHHECDGSSTTGSTCSATCQDACNCSCTTGFWSCSCTCSCPGGPGGTPQASTDPGHDIKITIPADERWELIQKIISTEDSDIAREIVANVGELHQLGKDKKVAEFTTLAGELDKKMMKLKGGTLDKLIDELT